MSNIKLRRNIKYKKQNSIKILSSIFKTMFNLAIYTLSVYTRSINLKFLISLERRKMGINSTSIKPPVPENRSITINF